MFPEKLPKQVKNQHFLILVPTWVCGRLGGVLDNLWSVFGRLGGVLEGLGTSCAVFSGRLGVDFGRLKGVFGHLVASWSVLGRPGGVLGPSWGILEAS